ARVPRAFVDATVAFANAARLAPAPPPRPRAATDVSVELVSRAEIQSGDTSVTEELVALDDRMIAISSRLRATPRRAIVLLDAGATYRIGPNRLHVELARRLARDGDLVLRIDQSGIGDSAPRDGAPDDDVYG